MLTGKPLSVTRTGRTPRHQHGTSLVEVLVAVFILSIGISGVAALQASSKRSNFEAAQRTTATDMVQDLVFRMRVNTAALSTYTADGAGRSVASGDLSSVDCGTDCTTTQLALYDLYEWSQVLSGAAEKLGTADAGGLTSPTACIQGPNGGSGTYTIAIAWRGLTRLSNPSLHTCGQGSGNYDHVSNGTTQSEVYRRIIVLETFIAEAV